jgi:hypothetical protein
VHYVDFLHLINSAFASNRSHPHLRIMSSNSTRDSKNDNTAVVMSASSDFTVLKFSGHIEGLAKEFIEKHRELDELSKTTEVLHAESKDIQDMLEIIENDGLYDTALNALRKCIAKMGNNLVGFPRHTKFWH